MLFVGVRGSYTRERLTHCILDDPEDGSIAQCRLVQELKHCCETGQHSSISPQDPLEHRYQLYGRQV
jgi:hypothetical protein